MILTELQPKVFGGNLIAIDPGQTTGVALFNNFDLIKVCQVKTNDMSQSSSWVDEIFSFPESYSGDSKIHATVIEDYRIYAWKLKMHTWSDVHTARVIGAIEYYCSLHSIDLHKQSAQFGKSFWTDSKLKRLEPSLYTPGRKHSNDATRHGLHWLIFTQSELKPKSKL